MRLQCITIALAAVDEGLNGMVKWVKWDGWSGAGRDMIRGSIVTKEAKWAEMGMGSNG